MDLGKEKHPDFEDFEFEKDETCAMLIEGIPRELRNQFKAECAKCERSMKDVLIEFMEDYTKPEEEDDNDSVY